MPKSQLLKVKSPLPIRNVYPATHIFLFGKAPKSWSGKPQDLRRQGNKATKHGAYTTGIFLYMMWYRTIPYPHHMTWYYDINYLYYIIYTVCILYLYSYIVCVYIYMIINFTIREHWSKLYTWRIFHGWWSFTAEFPSSFSTSHSPAATAVLTPNQDNQTDSHVCPSDMKRQTDWSKDHWHISYHDSVNVIPAVFVHGCPP